MADFDNDDCLERYFRRAREVPGMLSNPPGKIYEIISDADEIRRAIEATAAERKANCDPVRDTRVGILAEDIYVVAMRDAVRFPDGGYGLYNRLLLGTGVVMLPVFEKGIVLANAFRHGTRLWHLEAPRGMLEGDEGLEKHVQRELFEEIGARALEIIELGVVHTTPGVIDECLRLTLVRIDGVGQVDAHEAISEARVIPISECDRMIAAGKITDGPTLAAYLRARLRGLI